MRLKFPVLFMFLLALLPTACDTIHEFPEPGKEVDPTGVKINVRIICLPEIAEYSIVTKTAEPIDPTTDIESKYDRRFVVSIRTNEYVDTLVESHIITRPVNDTSALLVDTRLHTRKYKLVIWMDYVLKGTTTDLYYETGNGTKLNAIHQPVVSKYVGGSDFKDVQTFMTDLDLTKYAGDFFADITIPAPLIRPVAKITLLAKDLDEYATSIGFTGPLSELAKDIKMEFRYDGYYPSGYNAITAKLNDAESGYGFKSNSNYPYNVEGKDYMRAGFDYTFVNNESSSVTISAKITTKAGAFINEVNNVVVPITRGKETILIYKFLTKEYVPGIGIDPGFDGEYDYYVY